MRRNEAIPSVCDACSPLITFSPYPYSSRWHMHLPYTTSFRYNYITAPKYISQLVEHSFSFDICSRCSLLLNFLSTTQNFFEVIAIFQAQLISSWRILDILLWNWHPHNRVFIHGSCIRMSASCFVYSSFYVYSKGNQRSYRRIISTFSLNSSDNF